jgi:hypothetical protein
MMICGSMPCRLVGTKFSEKRAVSVFIPEDGDSPSRWYLPTSLHGVNTQQNIIVLTAVKTLNLTAGDVLM